MLQEKVLLGAGVLVLLGADTYVKYLPDQVRLWNRLPLRPGYIVYPLRILERLRWCDSIGGFDDPAQLWGDSCGFQNLFALLEHLRSDPALRPEVAVVADDPEGLDDESRNDDERELRWLRRVEGIALGAEETEFLVEVDDKGDTVGALLDRNKAVELGVLEEVLLVLR